MGTSQASTLSSAELLEKARETYEVYHFHVKQGSNGRRQDVMDGWTQLIGRDNLLIVDRYQDIPGKIADIVTQASSATLPTPDVTGVPTTPAADAIPVEEML